MRVPIIAHRRTKKLPPKPIELSPLAAKHYEQGYNAAQFGLSPSPTWTAAQAAGYQAGKAGAVPHYVNISGLPAQARRQ